MSWFILGLLILLFSTAILKLKVFRCEGVKIQYFLIAYLLKILTGIFFIWIYTGYYTKRNEADMYKYFDDGRILFEISSQSDKDFWSVMTGIGDEKKLTEKYLLQSHFWDKSPSLPFLNDNRFIIRFNALMMFISGGNIFIHMAVAVFCSFLGLTWFFRFLSAVSGMAEIPVFLIVFFTPSLLFWTSSILKESFMILGFGGFLYYLMNKELKLSIRIPALLFFGFILIVSKLYVLLLILPPAMAYLWTQKQSDRKVWWNYAVVNLLIIGLLLNADILTGGQNFMSVLANKQAEFKCLAEWMNAGSTVFVPDLSDHIEPFLEATPFALYNTLLRPAPWDNLNMAIWPAMVEIYFIIFVLTLAVIFRKRNLNLQLNFILFSVNFILLSALLIGWTTPVLGAIVRYRIIFLPFLLMLALVMFDFEKFKKFIRFNQ